MLIKNGSINITNPQPVKKASLLARFFFFEKTPLYNCFLHIPRAKRKLRFRWELCPNFFNKDTNIILNNLINLHQQIKLLVKRN